MKQEGKERVSLNDSFSPTWTFLRYNGILLDFYCPIKENNIIYITRFIFTVFIILLVLTYSVFQLCHLSLSWTLFSVDRFVKSLFGLIIATSAIAPQYQSLVNRKMFQQFFIDWNEIEIKLEFSSNVSNCTKTKRVTKRSYVAYLVVLILPSIIYFYLNEMNPDWSIFYSSVQSVRDVFNIHFLSFFHVSNLYYFNLYHYLGELVPTLFFYHAGCIVEDLERRLYDTCASIPKTYLANETREKSFRLIWQQYETILRFVNRANDLFAILIIWGQFRSFSMTCVTFYLATMSMNKRSDVVVSFVVLIFIDVLRVVFVNRLTSHLHFSRIQLQDTLGVLLSEKWYLMSDKDRQFLIVFQSRLSQGELGASPFNLYTISPTNLLSMLSLIVTYITVLLQTGM